jgi:hypothetical protein
MNTATVRLDLDVVEEAKRKCAPTKTPIGFHLSKIIRDKYKRDQVRNSEKVGGKKK